MFQAIVINFISKISPPGVFYFLNFSMSRKNRRCDVVGEVCAPHKKTLPWHPSLSMLTSFMYQKGLFVMDNGATSFVIYKTHTFQLCV